jgi:MerR family transcriptional regulator, redox-sensitive transcriptional activator SoxR
MTTRAADRSQRLLRIGEVVARSGVPASTLHFYEAEGLIRSSRSAGNQRRYPRDVLRRLGVIKAAQAVGISLTEIRGALGTLPEFRAPTDADWQRLATRWQSDLNERIERLSLLRDRLTGCIGCGCLSVKACPLFNPQDEQGRQGAGARFLQPARRRRGVRPAQTGSVGGETA